MLDYIWIITILGCYLYYIYQISHMEKGPLKFLILCLLSVLALLCSNYFNMDFLGWIAVAIILFFYDLFYDEEHIKYQWYKVVIPCILMMLGNLLSIPYVYLCEILFIFAFAMISHYRNYFSVANTIITIVMYLILILLIHMVYGQPIMYFVFTLSIMIFVFLEFTLNRYQRGFERNTTFFQQNVLSHQYEEIKNIYLDMRGWRHDYHNHLQTIKAHLALGNLDLAEEYLNELEKDLDSVDSYIKSGNLMVDAILNSKISIAKKNNINIICKAEAPTGISISEIDLCVILGNLLDNAMESCAQVENKSPFIRIYIGVIHSQLYISIQNSAKDILNFNERNYISTKRGNHGLGMKRVKILVDKYDGYLNLQNQPGIFASEVTLPLK